MTQNLKIKNLMRTVLALFSLVFLLTSCDATLNNVLNELALAIEEKDTGSSESGAEFLTDEATSQTSQTKQSTTKKTSQTKVTKSTTSVTSKNSPSTSRSDEDDVSEEGKVTFGEDYYEMEEVALYLHLFEELPPNYVRKKEASAAGWIPEEGNLWDVLPGAVIGGDSFGNFEGILPRKKGRKYYEADVNYEGGHRGGERLVYSSDGLIFYSDDHYNSFEEIYK